jgi:hypothetical protein
MCAILITTWSENYGDANAAVSQSFISAWHAIKSDKKIFLLGIVQALFEGSMYIFVLEWTPALTQALNKSNIDKTDNTRPPIPHGKNSKYRFFEINDWLFRICFCELYGSDDGRIEFI